MKLKNLLIRQMLPEDIPDAMRLKTIAGWNQTENDWKLYLETNPEGCFAAVINGRVVATVTTINHENILSWIGMMLVDPEFRRKGIASRLIKHAIEWLSECETIKLDATPAGKKVYDTLGFKDEYSLFRMTTGSLQFNETFNNSITLITDDDYREIAEMDKTVFGAGRIAVLKFLAQSNPETAWKLIRNGILKGYCMGRPGTNYYQIGPVVAKTAYNAIELSKAVMNNLAGQAVVIDVPASQHEFLQWLKSSGFIEERPFIRMYYGSNTNPGLPENVFAICGPELG